MCRGFASLAAQAERTLGEDPYAGHLSVFRGRREDLIMVIWFDGQGSCLFSRRLERGKFAWPSVNEGEVAMKPAQMAIPLGDLWECPHQVGTHVVTPRAIWLADTLGSLACTQIIPFSASVQTLRL